MTGNKKLFLSAVSSEFASYRNLLADDLKRPNLDVAVQEVLGVTGRSTLEKLDTYIRHCDAVIHLIGKATGGVPRSSIWDQRSSAPCDPAGAMGASFARAFGVRG